MESTLSAATLERIVEAMDRLSAPPPPPLSTAAIRDFPRQPVHTVYGGAHLFRPTTFERLGHLARQSMDLYARTPEEMAEGMGLGRGTTDASVLENVYAAVRRKLRFECVEDYRIDFEDGFGVRSDDEEDEWAVGAAKALADAYLASKAPNEGSTPSSFPPFVGIRVKALEPGLARRSLRTADRFITTLCEATAGELPPQFVLTIPKVTMPDQVEHFAEALAEMEGRRGLQPGSLPMEIMVETPSAFLSADGRVVLSNLVSAGKGHVRGAHFGTYDFTAAAGIAAPHQTMDHPLCDLARSLMVLSLGSTRVALSDGATNVLPIGPHKGVEGSPLTKDKWAENRRTVHHAWTLHGRHIRSSLVRGLYQGWDLHPAQIPVRYAVTYGFFLEALPTVMARWQQFQERAMQATRLGSTFDDAATGRGLIQFLGRALACGAIVESDLPS